VQSREQQPRLAGIELALADAMDQLHEADLNGYRIIEVRQLESSSGGSCERVKLRR
jgi:hypothetical protein